MKSANLVQIGKIVIDEHCPEPKLTSPEQTLVRVRYAAINADDHSAFAGYLGRFYNSQRLLHEFSGEIVALGPQAAAQGFAVGDHVSCNILRGCGVCPACRRGRTDLCSERSAAGELSAIENAVGLLARGGTLMLFSNYKVNDALRLSLMELYWKQITILTCFGAAKTNFTADYASTLRHLNIACLIDQILPLDEFQHAMQLYGSRQCLRILLKI